VSEAERGTRVRSPLWDNIKSMATIVAVIMVIKGCLVDQYTIPSPSMEPTLNGDPRFLRGDRVLVNKWLYGPRIPFTTIRLAKWQEPARWDIVVFHAPEGAGEHPVLIKRVAALPGETVRLHHGQLHIDGELVPFPEDFPERIEYYNNEDLLGIILRTGLPEERMYAEGLLQAQMRYGVTDDPAYTVVPEGHYFMLGDNSLKSADSRVWGWVPHENLYGRTFGIWWPLAHRRDFTGFSYTWWGRLLLFGLPAAFIAWEIHGWRSDRRRKREAAADADA